MRFAPTGLAGVLVIALAGGCSFCRAIFEPTGASDALAEPDRDDILPAPAAVRTGGPLLLAGGGRIATAAIGEASRAAGGAEARIVVVPLGSPDAEAGRTAVETWRKAGFPVVESLDLADDARAARQIREATFVWLTGADHVRLVAELVRRGLAVEIRARHAAGALVGGTNAGAAVAAELMLAGDEGESAMEQGRVRTVGGLGLLRGVIVDERFAAKKRFNRLTSAVLDHPQFVGIGIDDSTAVLVTGRTLRVVGEGNVVILDARGAQVRATKTGDASAATGVKMDVLSDGMTYELAKR